MSEVHHRMQALDGLRAVSILLVIFSHAWLGYVIPGGLGVTVFFFISGFIITRLLLSEHGEKGQISIKDFYLRRLFRLMPALSLYIALSLAVMWLTGQPLKARDFAAVLFYFSNYYNIFWGFVQGTLISPLRITWSLAVEEHYYFIFPFLFALMVARKRLFLAVIIGMLAAVLMWRLYLAGEGLGDQMIERLYMSTDTRVDSIFYGAALALIFECSAGFSIFLKKPGVFVAGLCLMLSTLLIRNEFYRQTFRYSVQGLALALMFGYLVLSDNVVSRSLSRPALTYVGRVSYSLYLYHWLILGLVRMIFTQWPIIYKIGIFLALSLLSAHLSYQYIERPFLSIGRGLIARRKMAKTCAVGL